MSGTVGLAEGEGLVGHCYTKGRKFPLTIVKWPGGRGRIWGGPYTLPQMGVLVGALGLLVLTRGVWAHFGLINIVIGLGVPYGLSLLVRHVQVEGRSPLSVAASAVGLVSRPSGGRMGGRPVRAGGARRVVGVCSVGWSPFPGEQGAETEVEKPVPAGAVARVRPVAVASSLAAARRGAPVRAVVRGEAAG
ncbi:hypothetical protein ACH4A3_29380 [Streptomyces sp. NPDC018007]|uniref:hypothetical protein n=1 Tax=Streptomyces sp. NPDC018007 TaxID=3365029 RepID=UPI0037AF075D